MPLLTTLFWFYKDWDTCVDRLRVMRRFNPSGKIYGLYGGPLSSARAAEDRLKQLLDDFWTFPEDKDAKWKWANGDLMIARWFQDRGQSLPWHTLFVMQWDMLVGAPLDRLFHMLQPGQILLSGLRQVEEVRSVWWWARGAEPETARDLRDFQELVANAYNYHGPLFACLFVVACLPRAFVERYVGSGPPAVGFMEYKIPTLAKIFEVPLCDTHPFQPGGWNPRAGLAGLSSSEIFLNAIGCEPPCSSIVREFSRPEGHRLFHPVRAAIKPWMLEPRHVWWVWRAMRGKESLLRFKAKLGKAYRRLLSGQTMSKIR
jgi:hypothetical protein